MEHDSQPEAYHVHVWIRGIHPMLWRRFLVRSDSTLADLHVVLQIAFDWTDFHLHRFRIRKKDYAVPRLGGLACHDARKIKLADLHFRINERFLYEYDFCNLWQHQVRIEKRWEIEASRSYALKVGVTGPVKRLGLHYTHLWSTCSQSVPSREQPSRGRQNSSSPSSFHSKVNSQQAPHCRGRCSSKSLNRTCTPSGAASAARARRRKA